MHLPFAGWIKDNTGWINVIQVVLLVTKGRVFQVEQLLAEKCIKRQVLTVVDGPFNLGGLLNVDGPPSMMALSALTS